MPLSPVDIKKEIMDRGDSIADLARRWGTSRVVVSRVIWRNGESVYPEIRKKLARYLKVPISEVGREPKPDLKTEAKAA